MKPSLRARLLIAHAALVAAAVLAIVGVEGRAVRARTVAREGELLARVATAAAREAARAGAPGQTFVDSLDTALGLRVTLIARDGRVVADSRADERSMENHAGRPEVRAALAGGAGWAVRRSRTTEVEYVYAAVPARGAGAVAVVRVAEPLRLVRPVSGALIRATTTAALATFAGSLLVLAWLATRLSARTRALRDVATRIGRGDGTARADERPADDLGRLGRALNEMRDALEARVGELRRERDERDRILAHMSDGVALLDGDDRLVHVNHRLAELVGAPRPAEPGTPFAAFARAPELAEAVAAAREAGRSIEREARLWSPVARVVRATATPLEGGRPEPVLLVVHDRTAAAAVERMRQDFVANVSHELRTPLTSLRGYAETLLEGALDDPEHREAFVRVIRDQAARLEALVQDLLALAELERPDVQLRYERLDLRALAAEHCHAFADAAARAGLALRLEPGDPVPIEGDRTRLGQAIANLLDNAIKYGERGDVTVQVGREDGRAFCAVRDHGPGIAEEDRARIFERFYRVDKARSREMGGTGLGLAIVKHAIALHGGEVTLEGRVGEGSTFRIVLPSGPPPGLARSPDFTRR